MIGRERFRELIAGRNADRIGFWMGDPVRETRKIYNAEMGVKDARGLSRIMRDDFRWIAPDYTCWLGNGPMFDVLNGKPRVSLSQPGIFAECEDTSEIEAYAGWPDPQNIDLNKLEAMFDEVHSDGMAVASGMWSCFFHVVADFFGMENYFIKMYTDPDVVYALTEHVVDFYIAANERIFSRLGSKMDAFFMGNDLGTQRDMLISPEAYREFVLPSQKRLIAQAKRYGIPVMNHSCGAISRVIPDLIDAGIDALHPLQAHAEGMDADNLKKFRGDILFVGGVDTQEILPNASPDEVYREVERLYHAFGARYIASPSHEGVLPNVPVGNIIAIRDAAEAYKAHTEDDVLI